MTATRQPQPVQQWPPAVATIVIVSFRTPELAAACAMSALRTLDLPSHVFIVDTSDGPGALTDPPHGLPVTYTQNVGYATALNIGFRNVTTPLLVACNADTEFPVDGIADLVLLFDEHPDLAVLGPRQVTPTGEIAHAGITECGDTSGGRGYGEPDHGQYTERFLPVEQVSGSVMLIRRKALEALGGVPIPAGGLYFEDATLCHRARKGGWQVAYTGLRTFTHHVAASPDAPEMNRATVAGVSRAAFDQELRAS